MTCHHPNPELCQLLGRHIHGRLWQIWIGDNVTVATRQRYIESWIESAALDADGHNRVQELLEDPTDGVEAAGPDRVTGVPQRNRVNGHAKHSQSTSRSQPKSQRKKRAGCCGKKRAGRRSKLDIVASFAESMERFGKDGLKLASQPERKGRGDICRDCPLQSSISTCQICKCFLPLKRSMRLEICPAKKWFPETTLFPPLETPTIRHLAMHILPVAGNDAWRWNIEQIAARNDLFNGRKSVVIALAPSSHKNVRRRQQSVATESADAVYREFDKNGIKHVTFTETINSVQLREVATWKEMLSPLQSTNSNEVTFCCHAKGVTHHPESIVREWAETMYHVCLDDWPSVERALNQHAMAGSIRRFGQFQTKGNHRWHYSGTFYWFRNDQFFSRNWTSIDKAFFGTESWPGRHFQAHECACLFGEDAGDPYHDESWVQLRSELDEWNLARGFV